MDFAEMLNSDSALFLDFDGSLVDIAPQPDAVIVPTGLLDTLRELQVLLAGAVAVISGRPIEDIDRFLHPLALPVAGVHGAERRGADGTLTLIDTQPLHLVELTAAALADSHPQLRVEIKRGSVALHFRQAPELETLCTTQMQAAVDASPGLSLQRGKMVVEAKPGGASKGRAIEAFLQESPFAGRTPIFVGDDCTDEAGFATVQRLGGRGVKVGEGKTAALERLASPTLLRRELEAAVSRARKVAA